jgi:hypothetical protein
VVLYGLCQKTRLHILRDKARSFLHTKLQVCSFWHTRHSIQRDVTGVCWVLVVLPWLNHWIVDRKFVIPQGPFTLAIFAAISSAIFLFWWMWMSYGCLDEGTHTQNINSSSTHSHSSEEENPTRNRSKNCKCKRSFQIARHEYVNRKTPSAVSYACCSRMWGMQLLR